MSPKPEGAQEPAGRVRAGRIGRRVALGFYFAFLVYITVVAFWSVVPQIFWPASSAPADADCATGLRELTVDLRARAAGGVTANASALDFAAWDDRYHALAARCESDDRYHRVGVLRHRLDTTLRRFAREDARLFDEVERSLTAATSPREGS
ncbi:MAG: hypothetical protein KF901_13875 [Myxococcales bacterium]|nr:hypothetical protein [Myxococcales bacterium]